MFSLTQSRNGQPFLDESFPLPTDAPFTTESALRTGLTYDQLHRLVARDLLRHPVRGVYVATQVPDSIPLRCACLRLVVPEDAIVVDQHAGWLHGAEMVLAPGEHLHLRPTSMFLPSGRGRLRNKLSSSGERNLLPEDIMELGGVRISTPIRTAWDLGRRRSTERSLAALDQMLRLRVFSKEHLVAGVDRFRGMRWVTTLRVMAPLADPRAESPPESVLRLRWIEVRLPAPEPQLEVWDAGELLAWLDLANERLRFAAEYDGIEWHSSPQQRDHDRGRRTAVERRADWLIQPFVKENLFGPKQNAERLLLEGAARARRRFGIHLP
jgi:hypothetical protein